MTPLSKAIAESGLTQKHIAEKAKIPLKTLALYVDGRLTVPEAELRAICEVLKRMFWELG